MRRREFLTLSATSIGGILVSSLDRKPFRLFAPSEQSVRIQLRFFTQPEALIVAAAASRIFPSDETGPGAQEAGVAVYIDRQLPGRGDGIAIATLRNHSKRTPLPNSATRAKRHRGRFIARG